MSDAACLRILMFTNTYLPHVGGVAHAVHTMAEGLRARGHVVKVVAPEFDNMVPDAEVLRVPAIHNFNGSDFSVGLPVPGLLDEPVEAFTPQLVHSHHPFLLGDTAVRIAAERGLPLVFTHHTLYERYTHYLAPEFPALRRFARELPTEYANLCDRVIAPSESIAKLLRRRGVRKPVHVCPTGIDTAFFAAGDRRRGRERFGLTAQTFVVGHVGRLAREKNLAFLGRAVAQHLAARPQSRFLVVGIGPEEKTLERIFRRARVEAQVLHAGVLRGSDLADVYAAMDVFAFASTSETQGLVLAEAMAAGVPVVALDAPGVREVVRDRWNGRLLPRSDAPAFAAALGALPAAPAAVRAAWRRNAKATAAGFDRAACLERLLSVYRTALSGESPLAVSDESPWQGSLRRLQAEWKLIGAKASALSEAFIA